MDYLQLSEEERDEMLAEALYGREREHFAYEVEIQHHQQLLAQLPTGDWPGEIAYLKGLGRDAMVANARSQEDLDAASAYADRDRIQGMLRASNIERARVERYHAATLAQLPKARRATGAARTTGPRSPSPAPTR